MTKDFALCLKIIEKVSFNIASEASYVYILSVVNDRWIGIGIGRTWRSAEPPPNQFTK